VSDIAGLDRSHLCWPQRHHRDRIAGERHEFDLETGTSPMNVNDRTDVTCLKPRVGSGLCEDYDVVLADGHFAS
jgi:hypothetical protein